MAETYLGMGDVVSLVEEHKNSLMKKKLENSKENRQNEFGFDFLPKFNR
jgi:signal recognition particle GTPase